MRLTSAGELDTTFGTGGVRTYNFAGDNAESFNAIAVQGTTWSSLEPPDPNLISPLDFTACTRMATGRITRDRRQHRVPEPHRAENERTGRHSTRHSCQCGQLTFSISRIPPTIGILTTDGAARADSFDPDTHTLGYTDSDLASVCARLHLRLGGHGGPFASWCSGGSDRASARPEARRSQRPVKQQQRSTGPERARGITAT